MTVYFLTYTDVFFYDHDKLLPLQSVIGRSMTGIEYELLHAMEPILYVIRKQNRQSPTQGLQCVFMSVSCCLSSPRRADLFVTKCCHLLLLFTLEQYSSFSVDLQKVTHVHQFNG